MPLPLIIKAAAIGGAAYAASRWLAGQRRQRLQSTSPYASATDRSDSSPGSAILRESYPGESSPGPGTASGPT